jgi:hypothetical protein
MQEFSLSREGSLRITWLRDRIREFVNQPLVNSPNGPVVGEIDLPLEKPSPIDPEHHRASQLAALERYQHLRAPFLEPHETRFEKFGLGA